MENYVGFYNDKHGMTQLGRVVLDGWLFGFIPRATARPCASVVTTRVLPLLRKSPPAP